MEGPLVSIIIPVYNAEKYLEQCLESVVHQTLQDIEIICIDNGSRDSSGNILQRYALDNRIKLLQITENKGTAFARNLGLEKARGKYVSFLDADDFFELDMLREAVSLAEEKDLDEVLFDAWYYSNRTGLNREVSFMVDKALLPAQPVFSYQDIPDAIFQITTTCIWNKLYRRDMIQANNIRFMDQYHQEPCTDDAFFSMISAVTAKRIGVIHKRFVHYRTDNPASQENASSNQYMRCYYAGKAVKERLLEMGVYNAVEKSFLNRVFGLCIHSLDFLTDSAAFEQYYCIFKEQIIPELNLADKDVSFFYSSSDYKKLQRILAGSAVNYLFDDLKHLREMGLSDNKFYPLPFSQLKPYKRVVLYGAGDVGVSYYRQLVCAKCFDIVLWVDRQYGTAGNSMPVSDPYDIPNYEYDCVIIAVLDQNTAESIRRFLHTLDVEEDRIMWIVE